MKNHNEPRSTDNKSTHKKKDQLKSFKTLNSFHPTTKHKTTSIVPIKKKVSSLYSLQEAYENISIITNNFLSFHTNQKKVLTFKATFSEWLRETFLDVVLLLRHFPDFNIFDYLNISQTYNEKMDTKEIAKRKEMLTIRNNIILSILVVAHEIRNCEQSGMISFEDCTKNSLPLFSSLDFLRPMIDKFKTLLIENDNRFTVSIEVEMYFLAFLGYKDKARIIRQKFSQYFKEFLLECNVPKFNIDQFLSMTLEAVLFTTYKDDEITFIRKILNNAAMRNFYIGLDYLMKNVEFCYLLSEGRIWKSIGTKMIPFNAHNLWIIYEERLEEIRRNALRETLVNEYEEKHKKINMRLLELGKENEGLEEYSSLVYQRKMLEKEVGFYSVTCLKDLLVIFFSCDLKELVFYFFEEFCKNSKNDAKVSLDIFDLCLEYDEDLAM